MGIDDCHCGGATVSTDQSTYAPGNTITVTYSGLPGNPGDWIALAAAGSDNTSFLDYRYASGASGTATFTAPAAGSYVVRAFAQGSYTLLGSSAAFTVSGAAISTDQSSYAPGSTITVTYAGLPGNPGDWIAFAVAGSDNTSYVDYQYASGASGTATFSASTPGTYVVRAFAQGTYTRLAESASFTVTSLNAMISTDQSSYNSGVTVTVTYSGLTGTFGDWIAVAVAGSDNTSYLDYQYASGASGTAFFTAPANGSFVVRAFIHGTYTLAAQSAVFTTCDAGKECFVAHLDGSQEVGPNASTATGSGSVIFDPVTNNISYTLQHTVSGATMAHIHQAPVGVNGPVIVGFTLVGQGASGTATLTAGQATALHAAGLYMNVHSGAFPGGEIRGVLLPQ